LTGDPLLPKLRRRYKKARGAAITAAPDMPELRFHDLRHCFGTMAAAGFDLVNVQAMMGHRELSTTQRYLHARPTAEDPAKLSRLIAAGLSQVPEAIPSRTLTLGLGFS
jgi:integrase